MTIVTCRGRNKILLVEKEVLVVINAHHHHYWDYHYDYHNYQLATTLRVCSYQSTCRSYLSDTVYHLKMSIYRLPPPAKPLQATNAFMMWQTTHAHVFEMTE